MRSAGCSLAAAVALAATSSAIAQEAEVLAPPVLVESPGSPALDPVKLSIARDIVDIGFPEEIRFAMFSAAEESLTDQIMATMVDLPDDPGLRAIFDEEFQTFTANTKPVLERHIPSLMEGWAQSYAAIFSRSELEDILALCRPLPGKDFSR